MLLLKALILGLVQGLTEFIPISSSAHLVIIPWMFGWDDPALESLPFDVALHLGTLVALLAFFAKDWVRIVRSGVASIVERKIGEDADRRLAWFLVIASVPGGIVGLLFEKKLEEWFHPSHGSIQSSAMIAMALIIVVLGGLLFLAERLAAHRRRMNQLTYFDSVLIGLAQALALFPGVSRSGSTITAGLALGLERETAARFSFLLSAPIVAGAGMKSLLTIYKGIQAGSITGSDFVLFVIGFAAATVSGYFCIRFLLRFLQKNPTNVFVYYRWVLAAVVLVIAVLRG